MDRIPPQNIEAEQSVLGSILRDPDAITKVIEILSPADFYRDGHRVAFEIMLDLFNNNLPTDLIAVTDELQKKGQLDKVGGATYVAQLSSSIPTAANVEYYARIVKEKSLTRQVILNANLILQSAYSGDYETADELINLAESSMFAIGQKNVKGTLIPAKEIAIKQIDVIQARDAAKGVTGISTTFRALDFWTAGFQPADLIIIAARPSMGKTSFALQVAKDGAIKNGTKTAIFSLEVSKESLVEKLLVNESMVDGQRMRIGKFTDEDYDKMSYALSRICGADIFIDDTPDITVPEMRSKCRKLKAEKGLDLVVIDYLQLMNCHKKVNGRNHEISEISRSIKLMARELNVPVIALSQLSRAVEQRQDKHPMMSDLRESGSLEQDADMVMFLYRDEYYNPNSEKKGITEVIIGKQRNGPIGTVELGFLKNFTKFVPLETRRDELSDLGRQVDMEWPGGKEGKDARH